MVEASGGPQLLGTLMRAEAAKWKKLVEAAKITIGCVGWCLSPCQRFFADLRGSKVSSPIGVNPLVNGGRLAAGQRGDFGQRADLNACA